MQPQWTIDQVSHEFDADNFDSDGDGYSNLFERATGMDSLGYDQQNAPLLTESPEGRPRISFVRYSNPISATGEDLIISLRRVSIYDLGCPPLLLWKIKLMLVVAWNDIPI